MIKILDFADVKKLEEIVSNWTKVTGLSAVVAGLDGVNITEIYSGDSVADRLARKDFTLDLTINDEKVAVVNGAKTDDDIDISAATSLLTCALENYINYEYNTEYSGKLIKNMTEGIAECERLVGVIQDKTKNLNTIQSRQNILALNASIEAARAGDAGKGFAVVAKEVGTLSQQSKELNEEISKTVMDISNAVHSMDTK